MVKIFNRLAYHAKALSEKYRSDGSTEEGSKEGFRGIANGTCLSEEEMEIELEDLEEASMQLKAEALLIHALASMYSEISDKYLFQGFQLISSLGAGDISGISAEEHLSRSEGRLVEFKKAAEPAILKIELDVSVLPFHTPTTDKMD